MSNKEIATQEYEQTVSHQNGRSSGGSRVVKYGIIAVIVVVLCGVGIGVFVSLQKDDSPLAATDAGRPGANGQFGPRGMGREGRGGFGNGQRPNVGEVTAISNDSVSINDRTGTNMTFKITSSTTVQNSGSSASIGDIKSGDTVFITTDSADTSTATRILLNPNFGGGRPMDAAQPTTDIDVDSI